jgi:hypothetical protein
MEIEAPAGALQQGQQQEQEQEQQQVQQQPPVGGAASPAVRQEQLGDMQQGPQDQQQAAPAPSLHQHQAYFDMVHAAKLQHIPQPAMLKVGILATACKYAYLAEHSPAAATALGLHLPSSSLGAMATVRCVSTRSHLLHLTSCTSPPAPHLLHLTSCTSPPAPHLLHLTSCTLPPADQLHASHSPSCLPLPCC